MSEEFNNSKSSKGIVVICILIALIAIIIGIFIGYTFTTNNSGKTEQQNTTTISSVDTNKYMASFKYDLKNNQLSNFDIAFLKVENNKENKIYSPLSIKYTLKMLEEGANGATKQQISNVLEDYVITKYTSNKNMSLANVLFIKDTFKDSVKKNYITNLQDKYNADVVFDSFTSTKNINDWVKNKTLNIIPEILSEIDEQQDFILINALGIDMEWKNKFIDPEHNYQKRIPRRCLLQT